MILTNCAACAAPLAHNAPRCVRCWTRYCDENCHRYASAVCADDDVTLDDFREAVATLEDVERTARRIFGDSYPFVLEIESELRFVRSALRRCERLPNV